jgi:hypothetical protein
LDDNGAAIILEDDLIVSEGLIFFMNAEYIKYSDDVNINVNFDNKVFHEQFIAVSLVRVNVYIWLSEADYEILRTLRCMSRI